MRSIRIIHTNDLHSHFEAMPKIAHYVKRRREEVRDEHLLMIDLGDHMDRSNPITEVSLGMANRKVLEASGYGWITMGNNEGITLTKEELNRLYTGISPHVIISNLFDEKGLDYPDWAKPYEIITMDGLRIGLIGLTTPYKEYYRLLGWQVMTAEEILPDLIRTLSPQVDFLILLSHLGLPNDRLIAQEYPEIRLILGAHSHHLLQEGEWIGSTLITQAGKDGHEVGEVLIEWVEGEEGGPQSWKMKARTFSTVEEEEDEEIAALIRRNERMAEEVLNREVILLHESLPVHWEEESPFANLLAQSVRIFTKADIALVNAGLLLHSLPEGVTTKKDLLRVCPHPINPCVISIRALELKEIIEEALQPEKVRQRVRGYGFRGEVLGFPALDGCEVYLEANGDRPKVVELMLGGKPLSPETVIRLGTIDMFMFLKPYQGLKKDLSPQFLLPDFLRTLLANELTREGAIEEARKTRFHWIS